MPPSPVRKLKGVPTEALAVRPKVPVKTEQLARPVLVPLSRDKRSKPKTGQKSGRQGAAGRRTSQLPTRGAFSPQSALIHSLVASGLQLFCCNHSASLLTALHLAVGQFPGCALLFTPSDQEITLSTAAASSLMCVSDGYHLFCLWVFGNSAVHLQIHGCLFHL